MTRGRFAFGHRTQRGFTLIELIIAVAIAGLITAGITAAIMQILTINTRSSNHMIAVRQVQQAGKEVSKDTLQAQSVNATGTHGFPLILTWDEWGTNQTNTVVYNLTDMPGGLKQLTRTHTFNSTDQQTALPIVAEYIDPDQTTCSPLGVLPSGGVLTFSVTATVGTQSETRVYEIEPRPDS
jgi:prepilin-type N-terminal cleavage/methylation domain-containing protein